MSSHLTQKRQSDQKQNGVGNPHRPDGVHGGGTRQVEHQKEDWVVDEQNREKAHHKRGDELATCLQHGEWATDKYKEQAACGCGKSAVNFRAKSQFIVACATAVIEE